MKTIYITLTLLLLTTLVKAQNPIIPLYQGNTKNVENAYYKDVDSLHNQYVGTWLFTNGNDSLKIVFRKRTMINIEGYLANYFIDELIGEYQYIENGIKKVNTLENIDQKLIGDSDYNLYAYSLMWPNTYPQCDECAVDEKRMVMAINEQSKRHLTGLSDQFVIRRYFDNEIEKLKVWFILSGNGIVLDENTGELSDETGFSLPYGEYTLTKQ
ncbi:DUF6705 family protein [Psychroserpens sp. NJDZ02]|uniref:DUF6705 family protein n=1 Tax=Psychroserpens sp. NJDZ02 TaxID=2570561 RepID=UPI0010A7CD25|nr:DUF6705 family protein [Psychroserpens sp. NJDZ02]QCE40959.1 hypothetical protein E9099_05850 [Psychroserpens sp. NJDZ02]